MAVLTVLNEQTLFLKKLMILLNYLLFCVRDRLRCLTAILPGHSINYL